MEKIRGDYNFWMDQYLYDNMQIVLNDAIKNNWDCLSILFGKEGTGKSTLGSQLCHVLDPNFGVENIVFTPQQFENAIENCDVGAAILWDEAITGANAAQHASGISQSIISRLTQIRKKKLKIFLCFPYLYMLNKYFVSRSLFTIYVYAKDFNDRGHAYFYSSNQGEILFNLMKEKYRYNYKGALNACRKAFYFNFSKQFCVDEIEYDNKKESARRDNEDAPSKNEILWKKRCGIMLKHIRDNTPLSISSFNKVLGIKGKGYLSEVIKSSDEL